MGASCCHYWDLYKGGREGGRGSGVRQQHLFQSPLVLTTITASLYYRPSIAPWQCSTQSCDQSLSRHYVYTAKGVRVCKNVRRWDWPPMHLCGMACQPGSDLLPYLLPKKPTNFQLCYVADWQVGGWHEVWLCWVEVGVLACKLKEIYGWHEVWASQSAS